jgi:hypothetical protein
LGKFDLQIEATAPNKESTDVAGAFGFPCRLQLVA